MTPRRDAMFRTYEFAYFGDRVDAVRTAVALWCFQNNCTVEITRLLEGGRFRLCGPEEAIRAAYRSAREWIQVR